MPRFLDDRCMDCGGCVGICPVDALELRDSRITVRSSCIECDLCVKLCPVEAFESLGRRAPLGKT